MLWIRQLLLLHVTVMHSGGKGTEFHSRGPPENTGDDQGITPSGSSSGFDSSDPTLVQIPPLSFVPTTSSEPSPSTSTENVVVTQFSTTTFIDLSTTSSTPTTSILSTSSSSSSSSTQETTTTLTYSPTPTIASNSHNASSFPIAALAGICAGTVVLFALIGLIVFWGLHRRRHNKWRNADAIDPFIDPVPSTATTPRHGVEKCLTKAGVGRRPVEADFLLLPPYVPYRPSVNVSTSSLSSGPPAEISPHEEDNIAERLERKRTLEGRPPAGGQYMSFLMDQYNPSHLANPGEGETSGQGRRETVDDAESMGGRPPTYRTHAFRS